MLNENWVFRRGDIYIVELSPKIGFVQSGTRPVIVLQKHPIVVDDDLLLLGVELSRLGRHGEILRRVGVPCIRPHIPAKRRKEKQRQCRQKVDDGPGERFRSVRAGRRCVHDHHRGRRRATRLGSRAAERKVPRAAGRGMGLPALALAGRIRTRDREAGGAPLPLQRRRFARGVQGTGSALAAEGFCGERYRPPRHRPLACRCGKEREACSRGRTLPPSYGGGCDMSRPAFKAGNPQRPDMEQPPIQRPETPKARKALSLKREEGIFRPLPKGRPEINFRLFRPFRSSAPRRANR